MSDFDTARQASGKITANYDCDASLVTTAGDPGSLAQQSNCVIEFEDSRPAEWDIPVPNPDKMTGDFVFTGCDYNACEIDFNLLPTPTMSPTSLPTVDCSAIDKRKACINTFGCTWESDGQGSGICQPGLFCPNKRKPCKETDGCFWKSNGDGKGRCNLCSTISKKNNCDIREECDWIDGACV